MEISRAREAISAESTHKTKTTPAYRRAYAIMSDNANLLDMKESGRVRRFEHVIYGKSAADDV